MSDETPGAAPGPPPPMAMFFNQAQVSHTAREFYFDFSQNGVALGRLVTTPEMFDALLSAMATARAKREQMLAAFAERTARPS